VKPVPVFFVAFVLAHTLNYAPNRSSTDEIRRLTSERKENGFDSRLMSEMGMFSTTIASR
jgi:hypothetical protein